MSIRTKLMVPILLTFVAAMSIVFIYLIIDQGNIKRKDLMAKIENTLSLVELTNTTNLWNMDSNATEQNILSFLKDRDIVSIEIKDAQDNSFIKKSNESKPQLIVRTTDMLHDKEKIGTVQITFTDYYINQAIIAIMLQILVIGLIILPIICIGLVLFMNVITNPIRKLTGIAKNIAAGQVTELADIRNQGEITELANSFNSMTTQLRDKAEVARKNTEILSRIIVKAKEIIQSLNSASKEIEAASQEQTTSASEYASAITEVSATLQELTITAKQITNNVGELVFSSEEVTKLLQQSEKQLLETVSQLEDVGAISKSNASEISELGKRSAIINEMVELIKEVANKTNILSINASIEASRSGEAGAGFSVVAAEIRELSKETIESAKKAEIAAREIKELLGSIIVSSENESSKVIGSGKTAKIVFDNMESIVAKINNNYSFTQKIDVSIKQQENGSIQAAETMRQMAEIARQSAETARQTLSAAKDIVTFSAELDSTVAKSD
jgi:methyl-accepting chemotaxis protein